MIQILQSTESTGEVFETQTPFMVFLDTYAAGWFLEYAVTKSDASQMNWKRWHHQPLQEHGELSHVLVYGATGMSFRMNSGTTGATAYRKAVNIKIFE